MLIFTLYGSDAKQNAQNKVYRNVVQIACLDDLLKAVQHDYTAAKFRDHTRCKENFVRSDVLVMDVDNDEATNAENAVTPRQIAQDLPNVQFYVVYSRNHMKQKGSKPAVPRFHVFFPHPIITDPQQEEALKAELCSRFPYYDGNAKDIARFFFASGDAPKGKAFDAGQLITDVIKLDAAQQSFETATPPAVKPAKQIGTIPEGTRNATLSANAFAYLKKHGDSKKAKELFDIRCTCCKPPLPNDECAKIWGSAVANYHKKIASRPDYVPPERYAQQQAEREKLFFDLLDVSDQSEAELFCDLHGDTLRFSPSVGWLTWNGSVYQVGDEQAQKLFRQFTDRQLDVAEKALAEKGAAVNAEEAKKLEAGLTAAEATELKAARQQQAQAKKQLKAIVRYRQNPKMNAVLNECKSKTFVDVKQLDSNPYLLNCPSCVIDLQTGEVRGNSPDDLCTKQCAVDPSGEGAELWEKFLRDFTCGDTELEEYLQQVCALAAVGQVSEEKLVIAFGDGANGKSTFFNTVSKVLGSYAGAISSDVLIDTRENNKAELATLKGKRLVIASELEEGRRLSTKNLKALSSTDTIKANPKYKEPFDFKPTHLCVLCTNHLPRVDTTDYGTWRRIIVIPCNARFEVDKSSTMLNYAEYLFHHAGGAVLSWIIAGALKLADRAGKLPPEPACVTCMWATYKNDNDWARQFIADCLEVNENATTPASIMALCYSAWCDSTGTHKRHTKELKAALKAKGFAWRHTRAGGFYYGLQPLYAVKQKRDVCDV